MVHVFAPERLAPGQQRTGRRPFNVGGGGDGSTLYVTATTALYRIEHMNGLRV